MKSDVLPAANPHAQLQALESIQASHPLPVHEPAIATQQHQDP